MKKKGFTLVEIAVILVIIGLIAGGILTGRELIASAAIRSQITQIEQYRVAINTFKGKYNNKLPGDIDDPDATNFGFAPRGASLVDNLNGSALSYGTSQGDNNGIILGYDPDFARDGSGFLGAGETLLFWMDLSQARLIGETFDSGHADTMMPLPVEGAQLSLYFPKAKLSSGSYVTIADALDEDAFYVQSITGRALPSKNYFKIWSISRLEQGSASTFNPQVIASSGLTVAQSFAIDSKVDDGIPYSGDIIALPKTPYYLPPYNVSGVPLSDRCFDLVAGTGEYRYKMDLDNGSNVICNLLWAF